AVWSTKAMMDGNHGMEAAGGMQVKSGARAGGAGELPAWHVGPQGCLRSGVGQTHHTTPPMLACQPGARRPCTNKLEAQKLKQWAGGSPKRVGLVIQGRPTHPH